MIRHRVRTPLMAEINVVPYIDVMLVLLVIFMITAPMLTLGIAVELPEANAESIDVEQRHEPIIVSIKSDGRYYLNIGQGDQEPMPMSMIASKVSKIVKQRTDIPVLVNGDRRVSYDTVIQLMSVLQKAGITNIGLITATPGQDSES